MHYQRWSKWGDPLITRARGWNRSAEERFWELVAKTDGCWIWRGATKNGYGVFYVGDGQVQAHRYAYELDRGSIPEGLTIDHLCHTEAVVECRDGSSCPHRRCVRPDHLEPVPLGDNIRRGGNATKTHCKRGHEFTPENTYVLKRGGRSCKTCLKMHAANLRAKRRASP
jgi:hypothetical protein